MRHPPGTCPVCEKPLQKGEDIVICPSCGAPYHRACYQQKGNCLFSAQHAAGFEYQPPGQPPTEPTPTTPKATGGVRCSNCQTVNDAANIFCENCGQPLHTAAKVVPGASGPTGEHPLGTPPFGVPPPGWGYGPQNLYKGEFDGIPANDWAEFIGSSAPVYLARLSAMDRLKRNVSFIFSAFVFSPTYFAYRKMWGWAGISLAATLLSWLPQLLNIAAVGGLPVPFGLSLSTIETLFSVTSYLYLFMRLLFGLFSLTLFRRFAAKRIQAIRKENPNDMDYHATLIRKGGVSVGGVLATIGVMLGVSFIASYLLGDVLTAYVAETLGLLI